MYMPDDPPHLPGAPNDKHWKPGSLCAFIADPADCQPATDPPRYGDIGADGAVALLAPKLGYIVFRSRDGNVYLSTFTLAQVA